MRAAVTPQIVWAIPNFGVPKLPLFRCGPLHHDWPCYTGITKFAILILFDVRAVIRNSLCNQFVIRAVIREIDNAAILVRFWSAPGDDLLDPETICHSLQNYKRPIASWLLAVL